MNVLLFGGTGMIGQAVLGACLEDQGVARVLSIGRSGLGRSHPKLREIVRDDLFDLSGIARDLAGYDACFFCLGVSSAGMSERDYRRATFDLTLAVARALAAASPSMTFLYVSGAGTDAAGTGRRMWARVKGETENALRALPFAAAVMLRPAAILPRRGIRSRTALYRWSYALTRPLWPLLRWLFPGSVTDSDTLARAMIRAARGGAPKPVLESDDINELGRSASRVGDR
jgi:uncharacterized protein YbjT (DUF2867 family)